MAETHCFPVAVACVFICLFSYTNAGGADVQSGSGGVNTHMQWLVPRTNWTDPSDPSAGYACESARAADYYGLGVRLGVYFSWFTAWIANGWVPSEIATAADQNAVFLFANVIAMIRCVITDVITQLDVLVLLHLSAGTIFSVLSLWGYRTCQYHVDGPDGVQSFGGFGTIFRLMLALGTQIIAIWYWHRGITQIPLDWGEDDTGPCRTVYTFMFAKVEANGSIRYWYLLVSFFWTFYFGIMFLSSTIAGYVRIRKMIKLASLAKWRTSSRLSYATGYNYGQLTMIFKILRVASIAWILFSIVMIEFTLNFNHVDGVLGPDGRLYYPSQLIPAIIGAFSFVRMMYKWYETWRDPDDKPGVAREATLSGPKQEFPKENILKLFSPPTHSVQPSEKQLYFEHNDIDPRMKGQPMFKRALAAFLPYVTLIRNWWTRPEPTPSSIENGDTLYSPNSTLQGSPTFPAHKGASESSPHWRQYHTAQD